MLLPGGITVTYALSNATSQSIYDQETGIWSVSSLTNPGATTELSIIVTVDANPQGTRMSVKAAIAGTDSIDNNADNDNATTTIIVNPRLTRY